MTGVTPQAEEYLETIVRLADRDEVATPSVLARALGVAPPSALGMVRRLTDQGLLTYSRREGALLTPQGRLQAEALRRRHRLAERLLTDLLHMPLARAHEIACRFEHVIDDEVEAYLTEALGHPSACPHGTPLDGASPPSWRPLAETAPGSVVRVRRLLDESRPVLEYLALLDIALDTRVLVRDVAPFDGPLIVEVDGVMHALARDMAVNVLVEGA
jgi:DtxR family Mn-dependent transcriptional regulator